MSIGVHITPTHLTASHSSHNMLFRCTNPEGWQWVTWYYDLSPCVAQTALFVLPSIVALTLGSHSLYRFSQSSKRDRPFRWQYSLTWDYYTKQVSHKATYSSLFSLTNTVINSLTTSHCIDHSGDLPLCIWRCAELGSASLAGRHVHHVSHPKIRGGTRQTCVNLSAAVLAL